MDVFLYKDGDILSRGKAIYLGLLGMQIEIDPLLFSKFTHIDAVLYIDTVDGSQRCKLNAVVTRRSSEGVGLTFINGTPQKYAKLQTFILHMENHTDRMASSVVPVPSY